MRTVSANDEEYENDFVRSLMAARSDPTALRHEVGALVGCWMHADEEVRRDFIAWMAEWEATLCSFRSGIIAIEDEAHRR